MGSSTTMRQRMAPIMTRLTDREREVAALVCNGLPNKTVAQKLNVSEGTVKTHLHHIFQKLGVRGRSELPVALLSVRRSANLHRALYVEPRQKAKLGFSN
jgi:DNA-binding NarL/FixJ family response regulator